MTAVSEHTSAPVLGKFETTRPSIAGLAMRALPEDDAWTVSLLVDGAHCASCIHTIERDIMKLRGVRHVHLNLSLRRVTVTWAGAQSFADAIAHTIEAAGYRAIPFSSETIAELDREKSKSLLTALAVTAFASTNVMMLSIAVWSGTGGDMEPATRSLLQMLSALIACPAIIYGAATFFRSAARVLLNGTTNIDVPISIGIMLTLALSLFEALRGGEHAYFESALGLVFVLLLGRVLEHHVRARARSAVEHMLKLKSFGAVVRQPDSTFHLVPTETVKPGDLVRVAPGERVPVDGSIVEGSSKIDISHVTGETSHKEAYSGMVLLAGSLNCGDTLLIRAERSFELSHLADIARLVGMAETRRGRYRSLSDRVASAWTLVIHGVSAATCLGWIALGGASPVEALVIAISVLIIACPCAVGLAVPAVETVAAGALMRRSIFVRSGDALERLAAIDTAVFDKTGTVTEPASVASGEELRQDARETVDALERKGIDVHLLSGDAAERVQRAAESAGIRKWTALASSSAKVAALERFRTRGHRALMVGDGLNDAPALSAAYVSASFTHGSAASQTAADVILPEHRLSTLIEAHACARHAMRIVRENLAIAFVYNALLVPIAMLGLVTPLGAALAMSASSLTVTLNALRAGRLPETSS